MLRGSAHFAWAVFCLQCFVMTPSLAAEKGKFDIWAEDRAQGVVGGFKMGSGVRRQGLNDVI